jgi:hypothetical protein
MRLLIALLLGSMSAGAASADPAVSGAYDCVECKGLLEVKNIKGDTYSAKIVVGGGSCGGEVVTKGTAHLSRKNELNLSYKSGQKRCVARISFVTDGAVVSDSCYTSEMEENSTCATLGKYKRR